MAAPEADAYERTSATALAWIDIAAVERLRTIPRSVALHAR